MQWRGEVFRIQTPPLTYVKLFSLERSLILFVNSVIEFKRTYIVFSAAQNSPPRPHRYKPTKARFPFRNPRYVTDLWLF